METTSSNKNTRDLGIITTTKDIRVLQEELQSYVNNKDFYTLRPFEILEGATISGKYTGLNRRRHHYSNCIFKDADLSQSGYTGSVFKSCTFDQSILDGTIFDSCSFTDCKFIDNDGQNRTLTATNFNSAVFINCEFSKVNLKCATASNAIFKNVRFLECAFDSVLWESAIFNTVTFDRCKLKRLNFEQCVFLDIHMKDMKLPFPAIPFIINGLTYLKTTNDTVRISAQNAVDKYISREDYINLLPTLEEFYSFTQNFFPLANIYVAQEKYDDAHKAVLNGIQDAIQRRLFKMLRSFCYILKSIPNLSAGDYYKIYTNIIGDVNLQMFNTSETYILSKYLGEVRHLLTTGTGETIAHINICTNIPEEESGKLHVLIDIINTLVDYAHTRATSHIEIRHYSPFNLFVEIASNVEHICAIVSTLCVIFSGIQKLRKAHIENNIRSLTEQKMRSEIQNEDANDVSNTETVPESVSLQKCYDKMDYTFVQQSQNNITNNGIIITNYYYYTTDGRL